MNNTTKVCQVCGAEMSGSVCKRCGWMHILHPGIIPETLREAEALHLETIRKRWKKDSTDQENCKSFDPQQNSNRDHLEDLSGNRNSSEELKSARYQIEKLKSKLEAMQNKVVELQSGEGRSRCSSFTDKTLKGVVVIKNLKTESYNVLPIYPNINTYGSAPSKGNHQKIPMRIRGMELLEKHFEIVADRRGKLMLLDLSNGTLKYNAANLPPQGLYVEANNIVLVNDILELQFASVTSDES